LFSTTIRKMPYKITKGITNLRRQFAFPTENHARRKIILAVICLLSIFVFCGITALESDKIIARASSVTGNGVEIYWDQACTKRTLSFNWGNINADSNNTVTIYVKNELSSGVLLYLKTTNWTPSESLSYISLNWNYSNEVLSQGQVIPIQLNLTVSPDIIDVVNFSFNTLITASER
jgi:hypothetical protein